MAADRRRRLLGTVRARASVAAAVVFGLALLLAATGLLAVLHRSLLGSVDAANRNRAQDLATQVSHGGVPHTLSVTHEEDALVQVVDHGGRVVAASGNLQGEPPLSRAVPGAGHTATTTVTGLPVSDGVRFRLAAITTGRAGATFTVFSASSLAPVDHTLATVQGILALGAPALVGLVAATTWVLVGRSLRPVESIRSQVDEISASALDLRVPEPATDDEIGRLARTMNSMLERLEGATDRQRRFVGDASHELQSPVASVRAGLDVALAHPDATDWPTIASRLRGESDRMDRLIRDLLYLARTDERPPAPPTHQVDLDDVVLDEVRRAAAMGGPRIDAHQVSGALVLGRREELARVVRNLLENARRFARSSVRVGLHAAGDQVELLVDDDGPGVPAELRERVFDRFTRRDDARARADGGTGLGLAITREIVVAHGGTIGVGDSDLGGARFAVTLPAAVVAATDVAVDARPRTRFDRRVRK
ncbi:MAG: Signal transduction histidine kinase [Acidimicrobiales bacterium]|nr:Signal transduction histidine kinase [Acidimicrobiales bacterium]